MTRELGISIKGLPKPTASYSAPHADFDVYRAKDLHSRMWNGRALKTLVSLARSSYQRYGKRPLFDAYDSKSAIYLVRAVYRQKGISGPVEEWLSVRMVPGDGKPVGLGEPEIHEARGKPVDYWMRRKLGARGFWKTIASSSRMCGIHPYSIRPNGSIYFLGDPHHHYTAICFALIHKQFLADYPLSRFPYRYITATIRKDFYRKSLGYVSQDKTVRPVHVSAHSFLGMHRGEIRVNRKIYSYPFPLYWLRAKKLLSLINGLRKKEHKAALSELKPWMLSGLTKSADKQVAIAGIRITPRKMQGLIDRFVPDAPELKITDSARWYRGMESVLRAAKVAPDKGHIQLR